MKFSVLMSIYYKEKGIFLNKALESVLVNQTIKPNQVVIVKDGPLTEELENILDYYISNFSNIITIVPLKENMGLGDALNEGLKHCKYELVARMDTDDICLKDRFEKQLKFMKNNKDVDVLGGYIYEFDHDINHLSRLKTLPNTQKEISKYIKYRNPINHMAVMFKKSAVIECGSYKPLYFNEDYYLWIRMFIKGKKFHNMPEPLVYARVGNGFIERRGSKKTIGSWKVLQDLMYSNNKINLVEKTRNLIAIHIFVYMPNSFRDVLYNVFLRKRIDKKAKIMN